MPIDVVPLSPIVPVLFAPFAGSFLGVLIRRLPEGRPVAAARSECESCHHALGPPDLVPIASFLLLRRRCRHCRAPIGAFHLRVELAALAVALWAAAAGGGADRVWAGCALGWALLALGWIDLRHMLLPDAITLPLLLLGLAATAALDPHALTGHALGAALGYAALRGVAICYRLLRGREGMGGGDAKLLAASGAWLGADALAWVVLGAALAGLLAAAAMRLRGHQVGRATALPFGPFLATATWLIWLYGPVATGFA